MNAMLIVFASSSSLLQHVLLDLDSPSWSLPAPWSYLPPVPPLSLGSRTMNLLHRLDFRATMLRAFGLVNANRVRAGLRELHGWQDYFDGQVVLTNTVWGVELHRSADAQGMHSHRNVNVQANGYTPRFKMTGPILPVGNTSATTSILNPSLPSYNIDWNKSLLRFLARAQKDDKKIVYINLGEGDDLVRSDVQAVLGGLKSHAKQLHVVWSMPKRSAKTLLGAIEDLPSFVHHVSFVPQFPFLSHFSSRLALVVTHATLANVQESLAAGLPVLLLPHPYVDQFEVANRFARTGAVYVVQRVQLTEENVRKSVEKMMKDDRSAKKHDNSRSMNHGTDQPPHLSLVHAVHVCVSQLRRSRSSSLASPPALV
jgi:hypothetical protein